MSTHSYHEYVETNPHATTMATYRRMGNLKSPSQTWRSPGSGLLDFTSPNQVCYNAPLKPLGEP